MKIALEKVAFLPFAYIMDKWRWDVFRGKIDESNYNQKWWQLRRMYQGVEEPVKRSEKDFDPGAKYHIASYTPYVRYFFADFLQFQFHRALCHHAGYRGELHKCDIFKSERAGSFLK
jgi:peptidyl-dipeptidase A